MSLSSISDIDSESYDINFKKIIYIKKKKVSDKKTEMLSVKKRPQKKEQFNRRVYSQ